MPSFLVAIIAALVGAIFWRLLGLIIGGFIGYLLAEVWDLRTRLRLLETKIKAMSSKSQSAESLHTAEKHHDTAASLEPYEPATITYTSKTHQAEHKAVTKEAAQSKSPAKHVPSKTPVIDKGYEAIVAFFTKGNVVVKLGGIVLFVGIGFLIKYAAEHSLISIELRLSGVALFAMGLLMVGWRLRSHKIEYALVVQGIGCAIIYMTLFSAYRMYHLLPATMTFILLLMIVILSVALALLQDSKALITIAIVGGFLAPILASSGSNNYNALFGFYSILNLGIFIVAYNKAWRPLNILGFFFTFTIGTAWAVKSFHPSYYIDIQCFLLLFFLFYAGISVLYALRAPPKLKGYVDSTLVFGLPLVAYSWQYKLIATQHFAYGQAFSALYLALFYAILSFVVYRHDSKKLVVLAQAFLSMAVLFATLTIPFALNASWVGSTWAIEGAALIWVGIKQNRWHTRLAGFSLQLIAQFAFLLNGNFSSTAMPYFNAFAMGAIVIVIAALLSSYLLSHQEGDQRAWEGVLAKILFVSGLIWWCDYGVKQNFLYFLQHKEISATIIFGEVNWVANTLANLLFFCLSCTVLWILFEKTKWQWFRNISILFLPTMILYQLYLLISTYEHQVIIWLGLLIVWYGILYRHQSRSAKYLDKVHVISCVYAIWQLSYCLHYLVYKADLFLSVWHVVDWTVFPILYVFIVLQQRVEKWWPFAKQLKPYKQNAAMVICVGLLFWILKTNCNTTGDMAPLPYIPLLNPIDIVSCFSLLLIMIWAIRERGFLEHYHPRAISYSYTAIGLSAFLWLNMLLIRTIHHWLGVAFDLNIMLDTRFVQAALSIYWTIIALIIMVVANKKMQRSLWTAGASLIAVVVLKLAFIDVSYEGMLEPIVSFIVVGILLLVIGYYSPLPPRPKRGK